MKGRLSPGTPSRPLVLMVDGHEDTLALYAIALTAMGFEVVAAKDAGEAFGRACRIHPDVIVTELKLRRATGWDLLEQLKGDPQTRLTPVVILTGNVQSATHERARREGCVAILIKPCLPERLAVAIRDVLFNRPSHEHASVSRVDAISEV